MQLRKLYRTIESIANKQFDNEEDVLKHVLQEIVQSEQIHLKGGRTWKFDPRTGTYVLIHQVGDIEPIKEHYRARSEPIFVWYSNPILNAPDV